MDFESRPGLQLTVLSREMSQMAPMFGHAEGLPMTNCNTKYDNDLLTTTQLWFDLTVNSVF